VPGRRRRACCGSGSTANSLLDRLLAWSRKALTTAWRAYACSPALARQPWPRDIDPDQSFLDEVRGPVPVAAEEVRSPPQPLTGGCGELDVRLLVTHQSLVPCLPERGERRSGCLSSSGGIDQGDESHAKHGECGEQPGSHAHQEGRSVERSDHRAVGRSPRLDRPDLGWRRHTRGFESDRDRDGQPPVDVEERTVEGELQRNDGPPNPNPPRVTPATSASRSPQVSRPGSRSARRCRSPPGTSLR
jgi:hypothetical protein